MADTARLLVLYHSSYGHTETLAYAAAHGARAVEGVHVSVKRVPELVPEEVMRSAGMKVDQPAPVADPRAANFPSASADAVGSAKVKDATVMTHRRQRSGSRSRPTPPRPS